jgi:RNA polymerase sigma-70 factor (ECF subfamily)
MTAPAETADATSLAGLILRLQQGDQTALEPFIEATQDTAFRIARSVLRDPHLCEDVVQDAYLTVYREIRSLRDVKAFRGWFGRIVANRCRRVGRQLRRDMAPPLQADEPQAEDVALGVSRRLDLKQALSGMGDADRSVLMLRALLQYSYEEIAHTLQVPMGTVKSRLANARRRLVAVWNRERSAGS